MIKRIKIFSILAIIFSLIVIIYQFYPKDVIKVSIAEPPEIKIPPLMASITQSDYKDFPIDHPRIIDFEIDEVMFSRLTNREQIDQLRDWILFTVVYAFGLSVEDINKCLYDLPTVRYGFTHPVANFEFGTARSVYIGDGQVIALIPSVSPEDTLDLLSNIADKHRKDIGEIPKKVLVFEYEIVPNKQYANVTRRNIIDGKNLFSESRGYYETTIVNLEDLKIFMNSIDDITFAKIEDNELILGGRNLRRNYRNIRVEDIAAIWQSEDEIHHKLEQFNKKWDNVTYQNEWEKNRLLNEMIEERKKLKIVQGSGFSLDPQFDYQKIEEYLYEIEPYFPSLYAFDTKLTKADMDRAITGIKNHDETALFELFQKLQNGSELEQEYGYLLYQSILVGDKFRFQSARYDGELQGTEVGMVLFYTDLMAKVWRFDYLSTAPVRKIEDFITHHNITLSTTYRKENEELPSTRLWFGPKSYGFQVLQDNKLLFSRSSTRIYAASSTLLNPGNEVTAAAWSAFSIEWWNNHYNEVAKYEQEYERLNEIMKWSLLISWLNDRGKVHFLKFLENVNVNRTNWFPEWGKKNQHKLKFTKWKEINFFPKNYKGTTTEAMPILETTAITQYKNTPHENIIQVSGGVSLGDKALFKSRVIPTKKLTKSLISRSNIDYKITTSGNSIQTLRGGKFNLEKISPNSSKVTSLAKDGTKLRGSHAEIGNMPFERTISRDASKISFSTRIGGNKLGSLKISKTENGFSTGWQGRNIDTGQSLGRRLSKSPLSERAKILSEDPNVESFFVTGEGEFMIKQFGENRWMKIATEYQPSANIPKGWQSKVSDYNGGKDNILLAWLEKDAATGTLTQEGYIVATPIKGGSKNIWRNSPIRGPPDRAKLSEIRYGDTTINAKLDTITGELYISKSDLAKATNNDILNFHKVIHNTDIAQIRNLAKTSHSKIKYAIPESRMGGGSNFYQNLRNRNFGNIAKQISKNPKNVRQYIDGHIRSEIERSIELIKINNPQKALRIYDELIDLYGPLPEFTLRKGTVLIEKGNARRAINVLEGNINRPLRSRTQFFDEINSRIQIASGRKAKNLYNYAKTADWQDIHARGPFLGGKVNPVNNKNNLILEYQLNELPKALNINPQKVNQFIGKKAAIYVEDAPGFNNLDWSPSTAHKTIENLISGDLGSIVKLPRGDISFFKPAKIYAPDGKTSFNPLTKSKISTSAKTTSSHPLKYRPYNIDGCPWDDDCDDDEKERAAKTNLNRDNSEDSVLLIIASKPD